MHENCRFSLADRPSRLALVRNNIWKSTDPRKAGNRAHDQLESSESDALDSVIDGVRRSGRDVGGGLNRWCGEGETSPSHTQWIFLHFAKCRGILESDPINNQ